MYLYLVLLITYGIGSKVIDFLFFFFSFGEMGLFNWPITKKTLTLGKIYPKIEA
jgi:hypothetical protein